jgi:DNA-binding response OmpR family regulator
MKFGHGGRPAARKARRTLEATGLEREVVGAGAAAAVSAGLALGSAGDRRRPLAWAAAGAAAARPGGARPDGALAFGHGADAVQTVPAVAEAVAAPDTWRPPLAVVDMDAGGAAFLAQTRAAVPTGTAVGRLPVIALTRRGDLRAKLDAFERGVDDILAVPFAPEELVARALAVWRRGYGEAAPVAPTIRRGELELDLHNRTVRAGEHDLHLTALEQSLLYLLAANAGRLLTRDEILDHLWGVDYAAESNVVDRHVRNLRAKLQDDWRRPRSIATVPGRGYRFLPTEGDTGEAPAAPPPPTR